MIVLACAGWSDYAHIVHVRGHLFAWHGPYVLPRWLNVWDCLHFLRGMPEKPHESNTCTFLITIAPEALFVTSLTGPMLFFSINRC